ncbi:RTA1-domain-containing protein [Lindgomyces ingoldianus]|uniref:RTA1-domain-containing protein n=1 Tax=Lindgomyces ingoldianus TaxID=673940 RepID=A0ACB6QBP7_9PLEO|nr:RTA1-domain-containing protein [Lindgomyces ingoldianus]KAF2463797.1 RTA1-domain-containing protein [Lindgomyces ingoldianus]
MGRPEHADTCTEISLACPIEATIYGYYPNLGANAFFAAFFGICMIAQILLGVKYRTWTYMIALTLGCLGEMVGYIGRIIMHGNPWSDIGFQIQICCLIISPAFVAGGIYLTLKHIVLNFGEKWSRLRAGWYTWIFISCDILSLVLQGAGGGIAATADTGSSMLDVGTNLMITGVIFQVVVLVFFGYFLGEYTLRTHRHRDELSSESLKLLNSSPFRMFMCAVVIAYIGILGRCAYRIPELTDGWGSDIMRNEVEFIVLEGAMIVISVLVLTVFHPGYCFPALANTIGKKKASHQKALSEDSGEEMMARA